MSWWSRWREPKPYNQGYLPEEGGHKVYFMEFGNPKGKPIVSLHGGPGGGCKAGHAAMFDLKKFRVIMFDQRGCKNSIPPGKTENNTTQDLLNDISRLLDFLKVEEKVIVKGGSWGSTLALLWAIDNPQRVELLLLSQIFLADRDAWQWENNDVAYFYPDFVGELKNKAQDSDIAKYYNDLIACDSLDKQLEAVNTYGFWERVRSSLNPQWDTLTELSPETLASQRIYIHYAANRFWLQDDVIMENIEKIAHIPAVIVHNRLDFVCPFKGAYRLHKGLPLSRLKVVADSGHVSKKLHKAMKEEFQRELTKKG